MIVSVTRRLFENIERKVQQGSVCKKCLPTLGTSVGLSGFPGRDHPLDPFATQSQLPRECDHKIIWHRGTSTRLQTSCVTCTNRKSKLSLSFNSILLSRGDSVCGGSDGNLDDSGSEPVIAGFCELVRAGGVLVSVVWWERTRSGC